MNDICRQHTIQCVYVAHPGSPTPRRPPATHTPKPFAPPLLARTPRDPPGTRKVEVTYQSVKMPAKAEKTPAKKTTKKAAAKKTTKKAAAKKTTKKAAKKP